MDKVVVVSIDSVPNLPPPPVMEVSEQQCKGANVVKIVIMWFLL
jgi:hypothetical protein